MPHRDLYHNVVKNALVKDGWTITDDPLYIEFEGLDFYVDLGAERVLGARKGNEYIAVEIKSFAGLSTLYEFHQAVGQYVDYRVVLQQDEPTRELYLAVPLDIYERFFTFRFAQLVIENVQLKHIVFAVDEEVIVKWIK